jgi:hypothetical protein
MSARIFCLTIALVVASSVTGAQAADPLVSWNDSAAKKAIVTFVKRLPIKAHRTLCPYPIASRCLTTTAPYGANNRCTFSCFLLWTGLSCLRRSIPNGRTRSPLPRCSRGTLKAALAGGEKAILEIVMATHAGMTTAAFEKVVRTGSPRPGIPQTDKRYTEMVYPADAGTADFFAIENFSRPFIVSGGGIEFMRPWTEAVYGIPPEQVVGSSIQTKFEMRDDGPVLVRLPKIELHR